MVYTKQFKSQYEIGDIVAYSDKSALSIGIINDISFDEKEYKFVYKIVYDYHVAEHVKIPNATPINIPFSIEELKDIAAMLDNNKISDNDESLIMDFSEGVAEDKILARASDNIKLFL